MISFARNHFPVDFLLLAWEIWKHVTLSYISFNLSDDGFFGGLSIKAASFNKHISRADCCSPTQGVKGTCLQHVNI